MADFFLNERMKAAIYISQAVGVRDDNILPVKIKRMHVNPSANVTRNVMATGSVYHDYKVVLPVEIIVDCALEKNSPNYDFAVKTIYCLYENSAINPSATTYTTTHAPFSMVRTKDGVLWKNLALTNCPHVEDTESYDVFMFQLKFAEFKLVDSTGFSPANKYTG